ncbi:MazG-like family protein [Streptomyces sp. 6N223]|uniref:MazG-like family protein n=1 Tax=Streptomyces sp. 6N223 TaxID=3457412 RepID=UPI003FCF3366
MHDIWDPIERLAARLEDHHSDLPVEQRRLFQILKITEEAGEVAEAVFGATGRNPRKGRTHTWEDVESEVCDVIITAMVTLARLTPEARTTFAAHLERIAERDWPRRTVAASREEERTP